MNANAEPMARSVSWLNTTVGITLLLLNVYVYFFPLFHQWGMSNRWTDLVLATAIRFRLFDDPRYSAFTGLVFLILGQVAWPGRKRVSDNGWAEWLVLGLLIFVCGCFFVQLAGAAYNYASDRVGFIVYVLFMGLSLYFVLRGTNKLLQHVTLPWSRQDPFDRQRGSFPQDRSRLDGPFVLSLQAEYQYKGRHHTTWINLANPRRGVLIMGSPGSGKSYSIIEPLIRQIIGKGMAMLIYDFKFDALSRYAYAHFLANRTLYPPNASFYCINFTDLTRTHRCNVLAPDTMSWISDAMGIARTILFSTNKTWGERLGDFFVESPVNFLAALIWFLRQYEGGLYCTLPHVIELSKLPYDKLFAVLDTEPDIAGLIDPFVQAFANGTTEMLDGQIASAKIPLARLSSPDIYFVLSTDELELDLNNPDAPKILCLGGSQARAEAITPVLSLYIDRINRICNQPSRYPMAMVADEFATVRATTMLTTITTGRSNNIIPVLAIQDLSQLRTLYTRDEAELLFAVCSNLFCGQLAGEMGRRVSELFPQILRERSSISVNSADTSTSTHQQWEQAVTAATVAGLSAGEFVGRVADDPDNEEQERAFHAKIVRSRKDDIDPVELPVVHPDGDKEVQQVYEQVRRDVEGIVAEVMRGIMGGMGGMGGKGLGGSGGSGGSEGLGGTDFLLGMSLPGQE